jgi:hypothetical protein
MRDWLGHFKKRGEGHCIFGGINPGLSLEELSKISKFHVSTAEVRKLHLLNGYEILVKKPESKRPFERSRCR